jgi:YD repeat-containing protein
MITTYTYKPLIGISTVTDPKGDTQTYIYDDFNRLKEVRDKDNNILSENQYHYRTPN